MIQPFRRNSVRFAAESYESFNSSKSSLAKLNLSKERTRKERSPTKSRNTMGSQKSVEVFPIVAKSALRKSMKVT